MSKRSTYNRLSSTTAAMVAAHAERQLSGMELPTELFPGVLSRINDNIASRKSSGFHIDPTVREEVGGLVDAAMGGYDHLVRPRRELNRYVAAVVQTNAQELQTARETLGLG